MDRYLLTEFKQPLVRESAADPKPGDTQVLVRLSAATLNYRDILVREGTYNPRFRLPLVPVSDGAGTVVSTGNRVADLASGDRVTLTYMEGWQDGPLTDKARHTTLGGPVDGVMTELRLVEASDLVKTPSELSDAEAACFPCAGVTAWAALVDHCRVKAGDWVLVQGTGGVSLFALQFAKAMGAQVAVISSSNAKLETVRRLGADYTLNYRQTPQWAKAILADVGAMQHVIEVGGGETLEQSIRLTATAGTIALIGVLAGVTAPIAVTSILMRGIRIQGVAVGSHRNMVDMFRAVEAHGIKPMIDRRFPFDSVEEAYDHLRAAAHMGKIVIDIAPSGATGG